MPNAYLKFRLLSNCSIFRRLKYRFLTSGSALLIVLAAVVLVTGLILAFITAVQTEVISSTAANKSSAVTNLANTALQCVLAQITDGTAGVPIDTNGNPQDGTVLAWASQPGMIRTYDTSGNPVKYYKLYSSKTMTLTNPSGTAALTDMPPVDWNSAGNRSLYTDLNAPVYDASGSLNYPIVDPGALPANGGVVQGFSISNAPGYVGGVASPTNNPAPMPAVWIYELKDGTLIVPSSTNGSAAVFTGTILPTAANPIVGRLAFWTDDETCKVNINTAGEGIYWDSPHFPAGSFPRDNVDYLNAQSTYPDVNYAWNQPFQNEFQRYPGHPAGVALSPILPSLQVLATSARTIGSTAAATLSTTMSSVTPRLAPGGSTGGTVTSAGAPPTPVDLTQAKRQALYASIDELIFASSGMTSLRGLTPGPTPTTQLVTKDDLERSKFFLTANSRAPEVNLFNLPRISIWPVHLDLATHPTSLFTSPFDRLSAFCSSIGTGAAAAIYHFQRAYPQDTSGDYNNIPRNQQLYQYLQNLTRSNIPGFGGSFISKYPLDRDQILTEIFDYIRCSGIFDPSLDNPPPGFATTGVNTTYAYAPFRNTVPLNFPLSNTQSPPPLLINGQVVPIHIGSTMGFGRCANLVGLGMLFIVTAESPKAAPLPGSAKKPAGTYWLNPGAPDDDGPSGDYYRAVSSQVLPATSMTSSPPPPSPPTAPAGPGYQQMGSFWVNPTLANPPVSLSTNLAPASNVRYVQMVILPDIYNVAPGITFYGADLELTIQGLDSMTLNGQPLFSPPTFSALGYGTFYKTKIFTNNFPFADGGTYDAKVSNKVWLRHHRDRHNAYNDYTHWQNNGYANGAPAYEFVSDPIKIDSTSGTMTFVGGPLTIQMWSCHDAWDSSDLGLGGASKAPTTPQLSPYLTFGGQSLTSKVFNNPANLIQTIHLQFPNATLPQPTLVIPSQMPGAALSPMATSAGLDDTSDAMTEPWSIAGRFNMLSELSNCPGAFPIHGNYAINLANNVSSTDVLRTMYNTHGDNRMLAASQTVPAAAFSPSSDYQSQVFLDQNYLSFEGCPNISLGRGSGQFGESITGTGDSVSDVPFSTQSTYFNNDYDLPTTSFFHAFGGFINKPDEGDEANASSNNTGYQTAPYFNAYTLSSTHGPSLYTPNKILSSPGMFGSLPTAIMANNQSLGSGANSGTPKNPWTTLLFRPQAIHPNIGVGQNLLGTLAPPYATPPDHLLMDLFWMPVVEPYAISDQLSTAGKINMNYQILPYTYITRNTGLVAVLKNAKMVAEPNDASGGNPAYNANGFRLGIDTTETGSLRQFKERFNSGDIFRSATQICDVYLMPTQDAKGNAQTWGSNSDAETFWTKNTTADNMREKVYSELYPRLTTKSNTYTVHVRVQSLQKTPSTPANEWVEGSDQVVAEYRGSSLVERYIDTNNTTIPDFALAANYTKNLRSFYQLRILNQKQFAP